MRVRIGRDASIVIEDFPLVTPASCKLIKLLKTQKEDIKIKIPKVFNEDVQDLNLRFGL